MARSQWWIGCPVFCSETWIHFVCVLTPGSCDPAQNQKVCIRACCCWGAAMNSAERWNVQLRQVPCTMVTISSWSWFVSEWLQVGLFHTCQQNTMQAYFGFMGKLMGRVACLNPIAYCTLASPIILYYFIYSSHIYFYFICNIYI